MYLYKERIAKPYYFLVTGGTLASDNTSKKNIKYLLERI